LGFALLTANLQNPPDLRGPKFFRNSDALALDAQRLARNIESRTFNVPFLEVIVKARLVFLLSLGLLIVTLPARAVTPQPIVSNESTPSVMLDKPGLYDLATVYPGTTVTVAVNGIALTGSKSWLGVVIGAGVTLTLKDAHITAGNYHGPALRAGGLGSGLVLVGNNSVESQNSNAGVNVPDTASLVIDGPGKLMARSETRFGDNGFGQAGIGGNRDQSSGPITIRNATIVASGDYGAGIGGGDGSGNNIVIVNSSVTASGGRSSAGIGGSAGIGSSIVIIASAVKAVGGEEHIRGGGAGIGGGAASSGKNIRIDAASVVQAIGGAGTSAWLGGGGGGGAGIGGGGGTDDDGVDGGTASDLRVSGALAAGSSGGAGGRGSNSNNVIGGAGGQGALCGHGGGTGTSSAATVPGGKGTNGKEIGKCIVDSRKDIDVALANHPDPAYKGDSRLGYPPYPSSPVITDPSNAMLTADGSASFSVTTSGGMSALAHQWQVSTDGGGTWTDIADGGIYSGTTTNTLKLTGAAITDSSKQYRCVVSDELWQDAASSAAILMPPLAAANDPAVLPYSGLSFGHGDWELACDNTRTCRAAGYHSDADDDGHRLSVLLTRKAGPDEPVTGQLMIAQTDQVPILDSPPPVLELALRINEKTVGQVTVPKSSLVIDLTPRQVTALLAALVRASRIEFAHDANDSWRLSDAGAAAVLLKMDEFQGRVGTSGALVRKGKKAEISVLPPLPVPVIEVARFHPPVPGDELFVEKNSASLIEAICSIEGEDDCPFLSEEGEVSFKGEGSLSATRLTETKMLLSANCWRGAYNSGEGYWVINSTPPWRPVLVTDIGGGYAGNDISGGVISSSQKGRGLGDCWSLNEWTWDGKQFIHTQSSTTGMCKLIAAGGAWALPTIVTNVRGPTSKAR